MVSLLAYKLHFYNSAYLNNINNYIFLIVIQFPEVLESHFRRLQTDCASQLHIINTLPKPRITTDIEVRLMPIRVFNQVIFNIQIYNDQLLKCEVHFYCFCCAYVLTNDVVVVYLYIGII